MLTISPPSFGYPLEDLRSHELQNMLYYNGETETSESLLNSPTFQQQVPLQDERCKHFSLIDDEPKMAKKINHNASERDRRKKINSLYSSLRSLLPPAYQEKKLSIAATVSRVLKYIPELLKEMEALNKKKECLMRRINSDQENSVSLKKPKKFSTDQISSSSSSAVSATQISDGELMIQMAAMKFSSSLYVDVLSRLEQDGLVLLNSSCFQSFQGRVFYNLHLQVCRAQIMDLERLKKQLLSLYENQKEPFLSNLKSISQIADIFVNK